jgi:hypothetical protein
VFNPTLQMRRLAGKLAMFLAGVYVLVVFVVIGAVSRGTRLPMLE